MPVVGAGRLVGRVRIRTSWRHRSRVVMAFSTRFGPTMRHRAGQPPSNRLGTCGDRTSSAGCGGAKSSVKPGPSSRVMVRSCPGRSENGASVSSHAKPTIQPGPESMSALRPAPFTQRDRGRVAKLSGSCGMLVPFILNPDATITPGSAAASRRRRTPNAEPRTPGQAAVLPRCGNIARRAASSMSALNA